MPAPELTVQTPGDPLANTVSTTTPTTGNPNATETDTANAQAPKPSEFVSRHNGGGRWIVIDASAPQVDGKDVKIGDFTGTKEEALAEAERLSAGGEPLVLDPQRTNEQVSAVQAQPTTGDIDATTLKQPVMTPDGWLCPEPKAKD